MEQPNWNDNEINELKKLTAEGLNARQIGEKMGKSRNSILGKLFRLDLRIRSTNRSTKPSFWSVDNLKLLSGYIHSPLGYSKPEIAVQMGISTSMLRRGLGYMRDPAIKRLKVRRRGLAARPGGGRLPPAERPEPVVEDISKAVLIGGLTAHTCRFPVGDAVGHLMLHCGQEPLPGFPYCAGHARRAYA